MDHIYFFTLKKYRSNLQKKFNFEIFRVDISSYSFNEDHKYQRESQDKYYRIISKNSIDSFKQIIKKVFSTKYFEIKTKYFKFKKYKRNA